jgi:hypothetical protein
MKRLLMLTAVLTVGCSTSPGPLGGCPAGSPVQECVTRGEAWAALQQEEGGTDGGLAEGCPSPEQLGSAGLSKLGLSGYRFEGEASWHEETDRCCYLTVGAGC